MQRRQFLSAGTSLVAGATVGMPVQSASAADSQGRMSDEGERHAATWMAFGASDEIWGRRLKAGAQANLALIAQTIAQLEPVQMLVSAQDYDLAARLCGSKVKLLIQDIDDLWMRDTGPVFVKKAGGGFAGVDFNFNGWGNKQQHRNDAKVAAFVAKTAGVPVLKSSLILEGGGIEVDGQGTAIITESCVLNGNRNPGVSKAQCEQELQRVLGIDKVIWLPGIAGRDITDGHTDFYARFCAPGVVVAGFENDTSSPEHAVTQRHLAILRKATDARGRPLQVLRMPGPDDVRPQYANKDFAAGYINFYVCNGAVICPEFGDARADRNCKAILREQFPGRDIVQLNIDAIAAGGGGIHCTTQQQPA
ncbi:agmatine deiminase family protein [Comamonas piscis]|uniref:Agmatine deiminase family protein n=1 Tax=Comamonas piscis TaxID=1562974 RepID=A0A7G5EE35_9BURK|nr:agmatine deiminase family protein [Comamonas piscis]QMV72260.1 agmatine deiminase family protein [Comamonas piscis]WSO35020.1 agmatine deiminase family protein [Comamonas piscis]